MNKNIFSYSSWLLIAIIYITSLFCYKGWEHESVVSGGDQFGYYVYVPAVFIYHDAGSFDKTLDAVHRKDLYPHSIYNVTGIAELSRSPSGRYYSKYTFGVAILQTPFFWVAHIYSLMASKPADGFQPIYIFFNCLSAVFYSLLGLWVLMRLLQRFFSDRVTAATLLALALATNLYYMQVSRGAMAHPYLFFLYAIMLYSTIAFFDNSRLAMLAIASLCCGMIALIRPNEAVCILIPIIYGIGTLGLKGFFALFTTQPKMILAPLTFLLPIIPLLLYWKYTSGSFIFYSYTTEHFDFRHPHIWSGSMSGHNGWLVYTPVMLLALLGMVVLLFKNKPLFFSISTFLAIHIFVIYSWWCWNYINGFGSRPMVETYPLLALPLAYFIEWCSTRVFTKIVIGLLLVFFAWLNMFQTYQNHIGILWSENATHTYLLHTMGKTKISRTDFIEYDTDESQPDTTLLKYKSTLYSNDMENLSGALQADKDSTEVWSGKYSFRMTKERETALNLKVTPKAGNFKPGDWIKISAHCRSTGFTGLYDQTELVTQFVVAGEKSKENKYKALRIENKLGNRDNQIWISNPNLWDEVHYYTQVPKGMQDTDKLVFFLYKPHGPPLLVDDLKLEVHGY